MSTKRNSKKIITEDEELEEERLFEPVERAQPPKKSWLNVGLILLAIIILLALAGLLWQNQKLQNKIKSSSSTSQNTQTEDDNKKLVEAVGKLIILPENEQPTIATVADLEKLKDQPFFAQAQIGDKVLIYTNAKKAILFRASENKIIEIAPLNIGSGESNTQATSTTETAAVVMTLEIRNGSGKGGAGATFKTKLSGNSQFSVTKVGNAAVSYPKTQLYVANPSKFSIQVSTLKQLASAEVVTVLPAGEASSTADAVLILGVQ